MSTPDSFGSRLAEARKLAGLTQQDLGRGLGTDGADCGKQVVYGWEKNQHYPRVDQLMLICRRLRCSSDYLLFGGQVDTNPRMLAAQRALNQLTDVEREELMRAITQPGLPDHLVEERIPATRRPAKDPLSPAQQREFDRILESRRRKETPASKRRA